MHTRIVLLDLARVFSALAVLIFHYFYNGTRGNKIPFIKEFEFIQPLAKYGFLGVNFFFIISGFVIFFSLQNKTIQSFLRSRALRLYPTFWVAIIFTTIVTNTFGGNILESITWKQFVANVTMYPVLFGEANIDGVYWTLAYELKFYMFIGITGLILFKHKFEKIFICWFLYIVVFRVFSIQAPLSDYYYLYFIQGAAFAMGSKSTFNSRIILFLALIFVALSTDFSVMTLNSGRFFFNLLSYSYFIFVLLFREKFQTSFLSDLGKLTYPLYLIHAHIGYILINIFFDLGFRYMAISLTVVIILILAVLTDYLGKKLTQLLKTTQKSS